METAESKPQEDDRNRPKLVVELKELDEIYQRFKLVFILSNVLTMLLGAYVIMRVWSAFFFISEMLAFQRVALDAPASPELAARVARWTFWTWFREPLDVTAFVSFLLALFRLGRAEGHPQAQ